MTPTEKALSEALLEIKAYGDKLNRRGLVADGEDFWDSYRVATAALASVSSTQPVATLSATALEDAAWAGIDLTVRDGDWTGTLEEWRKRPRPVVYTGPANHSTTQAEEVEDEARRLYNKYSGNHPTIHSNRFPSWDEMSDDARNEWRQKARAAAPQPQNDASPGVREALAAIRRAAARTPHREDTLALYAAHATLSHQPAVTPQASGGEEDLQADIEELKDALDGFKPGCCNTLFPINAVRRCVESMIAALTPRADEPAPYCAVCDNNREVDTEADPTVRPCPKCSESAPTVDGGAVAWYMYADTEHWVTLDAGEADENRNNGCQVRPLVFGDTHPAPAPDVARLVATMKRMWDCGHSERSVDFESEARALTAAQQEKE